MWHSSANLLVNWLPQLNKTDEQSKSGVQPQSHRCMVKWDEHTDPGSELWCCLRHVLRHRPICCMYIWPNIHMITRIDYTTSDRHKTNLVVSKQAFLVGVPICTAVCKRIEKGKQAREACSVKDTTKIGVCVTGSVLYPFHMWSSVHRANWPVSYVYKRPPYFIQKTSMVIQLGRTFPQRGFMLDYNRSSVFIHCKNWQVKSMRHTTYIVRHVGEPPFLMQQTKKASCVGHKVSISVCAYVLLK